MNNEYEKIDPYQGFIRGNLFDDMYVPYKNYVSKEITPSSEKEYDMLLVQIYQAAIHDLTLYLDIHPEDESAIKLRYDYQKMYNDAKNNYEEKYYILELNSNKTDKKPWNWALNSFPWDARN